MCLGSGALFWALTFWYEDPRAMRVALYVFDIQALHRDYYLDSGVYVCPLSHTHTYTHVHTLE